MAPIDLPTRDRILGAAETLFAAHGFDGVSLRMLTAAAQVPLGSVAYHFGSKEGLYRAIWTDWMGRIHGDPPDRQAGAGATLEQRLRHAVAAFFAGPRAILREERGRLFIAIMVHEAHDPDQAGRGLMDQFVRPNAERARAVLADLLPAVPEESFAVGFLMTASALRIVIENDRSPHPLTVRTHAEYDRLFSIITDFVVSGWLGIVAGSAPGLLSER